MNREPGAHCQRQSISSQHLITSWSRRTKEPRNHSGAAGDTRATGRGWTSFGMEDCRSLALVKAESRVGDQVRDLPGPLWDVRQAKRQVCARNLMYWTASGQFKLECTLHSVHPKNQFTNGDAHTTIYYNTKNITKNCVLLPICRI